MLGELEEYDIEVELTLFPTEEGGLEDGLYSGTRSFHLYLDGILWIAALFFPEREILLPGETSSVFVRFIYRPDLLIGRLHPGKPFLLKNGGTIGQGVILSLLYFEQHAEQARQQEEEERINLLADPNKKQPILVGQWPRRRLRKKKRKHE